MVVEVSLLGGGGVSEEFVLSSQPSKACSRSCVMKSELLRRR